MRDQTAETPDLWQFPPERTAIRESIFNAVGHLPVKDKGSAVERLVDLCFEALWAEAVPELAPTEGSDFDITPEELEIERRSLLNDIERVTRAVSRLKARLLRDDRSVISSDVAIYPGALAERYSRSPQEAEVILRCIVDSTTSLTDLVRASKPGRPKRQIDLPLRLVHAVAQYRQEDAQLTYTPGWSTPTMQPGGKRGGQRDRLDDDELDLPHDTALMTEAVFTAFGLFKDRPDLRTHINRYRDVYLKGGRKPSEASFNDMATPES